MWALGADKMPAKGCVFAHAENSSGNTWILSLTIDETSLFPVIAQEGGQVLTIRPACSELIRALPRRVYEREEDSSKNKQRSLPKTK